MSENFPNSEYYEYTYKPTQEIDPSEDAEALRRRLLLEEEEREAKKNRGNYRCSKCGEPKKGHVCKFQPRYRRKELSEADICHKEVQVELDPNLTVRCLPLEQQGYYESYFSPDYYLQPQSNQNR
mmetsp:Transcript_10693/g.11122  ORF Transcript_10693/g.11122 Transcript_10693/m.11122 type:complete len:125 (+) Transcript_10693:46-420(+)